MQKAKSNEVCRWKYRIFGQAWFDWILSFIKPFVTSEKPYWLNLGTGSGVQAGPAPASGLLQAECQAFPETPCLHVPWIILPRLQGFHLQP